MGSLEVPFDWKSAWLCLRKIFSYDLCFFVVSVAVAFCWMTVEGTNAQGSVVSTSTCTLPVNGASAVECLL